jgi:hypothetical protein
MIVGLSSKTLKSWLRSWYQALQAALKSKARLAAFRKDRGDQGFIFTLRVRYGFWKMGPPDPLIMATAAKEFFDVVGE